METYNETKSTNESKKSEYLLSDSLSRPWSVAVGDLNGDGKPDLAVANNGSTTVSVLINTTAPGGATPTFAAKQDFTTGTSPISVAVGDLNGDGKPDLAVANYSSATVSVLFNTTAPGGATATFAVKQDSAAGSLPYSVAVGDLNGDGKPDLAVANNGSNTVSVLINTTDPGGATPSFAAQQDFGTGASPIFVAVGDLNGDGKPDLAVANVNSSTVSVLLNTTASCSLVVTTTADSGAGSLRDAIICSNTTAGLDTISFNIPGGGVKTISPTSALPTITDPVIINGYTQPGAIQNTNATGGLNTVIMIELNGTSAGSSVDGLKITAGGSTVKGLAINRFSGYGIFLTTNGGNTIQGNFLGTDTSGTADLGNTGNGVTAGDAPNNTIGGTTPGARNLISGNNESGVSMYGSSGTLNLVQGNLIGTDVTGTSNLGNTNSGVYIFNAPNNTIGGTVLGAGNIISGNIVNGVVIDSSNATGNQVQGNYIGTNASGAAALGNANHGVVIASAPGNTIGGTASGSRNVISGNIGHGVEITNAPQTSGASATMNIIQGNFIGTQADGSSPLGNSLNGVALFASGGNNSIGGTAAGAGNTIAFNAGVGVRLASNSGTGNGIISNSIFSNAGLGIDLNGDGVTPNDLGDGDTGPNNLQNFPVLTSAMSGGGITTIQGTLNSTASTTFRVEFFSNPVCDPSGNGEGQTFLGFTSVTTTGNNAAINVVLPSAVTPGQFVTSTATDPGGNTSEFSQCVQATAAPTPTPMISISVGTIPTGRSFTVDGTTYASAQNFTWVTGSLHNIATTTPQQTAGARYDWSSWSDGGAISHSVSPTAATNYVANFTASNVTVSGRVVTSDFRGLRNSTVLMTDPNGVVRTVTTSSFGYFSFSNVTTGVRYVFRVQSRLFRYAPVSATINDEITLPDFVGLE